MYRHKNDAENEKKENNDGCRKRGFSGMGQGSRSFREIYDFIIAPIKRRNQPKKKLDASPVRKRHPVDEEFISQYRHSKSQEPIPEW